jgi:hypothetical protein
MTLEIRCRLVGGVGNQLFQYASGFRVASCLNARFVVDTRWIEKYLPHTDSDIRQLEFYNPDFEITAKSHGDLNPLWDRITQKLASRDKHLGKFLRIYSNEELDLDEIESYKKPVELRGYFQNRWSVESALQEIPSFSLRLAMESEALIAAKKLLSNNFVSVHVRRGDYLNKNSIHKVLTQDYYSEALDFLFRTIPRNTLLLIFSDDPSYVGNLLPKNISYTLASDLKLNSLEELHLMSMASGFIIANSTYSFWPAILAPDNAQVIAPASWFKSGERDLTRLYPAHWEKIPT